MSGNRTNINAGIIGALMLAAATLLFHWLFCSEVLTDGQYGIFLVIVSAPLGAALGSVTRRCLLYAREGDYHRASRECLIWSIPIVFLTAIALVGYSGGWKTHDFVFNMGTFGLPLFWAAGLLIQGSLLRRQGRNTQPPGRQNL